ncbi:MAG: ABC transporter substrate-binding protein [Chloroflexota bacterium]
MHRPKRRRALQISGSGLIAGALLSTAFMSGATSSLAARPAKPGYGGTLSIYNAQPDCLDPQKTGLSASYADFVYVVDSLVILDKKGHPKPDLALKWKTANGGKQITFYLRHGVKFSNGDPFTARDVKYTFDRAVNPATKSPSSASELSAVTKTTVLNTYTVRLTLKTAFRPLFGNLGNAYTGIIDRKAVNKEGSAGFCQKPVGTGPYKITSTGTAFDTVVFQANKYHTWNPSVYRNRRKPYISKIVSHVITSDATIGSELLNGQLDLGAVPSSQLSRLKGNKNLRLHNIPNQGEDFLGFNTAQAPFNNVQVRKAVAEAVNRSALIRAVLSGQGVPAYSPLAAKIPFYDKNAKKFLPPYNTADAQRIIAANHATGPYTLLEPAEGPEFNTLAELIQAELGQVGMTVTVVAKPIGDYLSLAGKGQFDMNILGYGYNDPDILYSLYDSANGKGAGLNFSNYVNPTLDNLLVKGRTTLNTKTAAKYYNQAQELMNKQVVVDPLFTATSPLAVRTRVKGFYDTNLNVAIPFTDFWLIGR